MSSDAAVGGGVNPEPMQAHSPADEKTSTFADEKKVERVVTSEENLVYDDNEEEPELHARTYFALAAMFLLNLVQVFALQGPPAVVRNHNDSESLAGAGLTVAACSFPTSERISTTRPVRHGCPTPFHSFKP